jgi:hypothetical protein
VEEDQNAFGRAGLRHLDPVGAVFDSAGYSLAAIGSLSCERQQKKCGHRRNMSKTHLLASSLKPLTPPTVFAEVLQFAGPSRFRERRMPHA